MKKKLRKISLAGAWFISWTPRRVMIGRPHTHRHLTIEERKRGLNFHLTDERFPPGHPERNRPLADIRFARLKKLEDDLKAAGVRAFIESLIPVTAEELDGAGFKLMTVESFGMTAIRAIVKPRLRPDLRLRAPSEAELLDIANHAMRRLRPVGDLDALVDRTPGTVSAVLVADEEYISWQLYYYPDGLIHPDGSKLSPGWYALVDRDAIGSACAKALLDNIGPNFFAKIDRALRFIGFNPFGISAIELEDVYRRIAAGESVESIRAERAAQSASQTCPAKPTSSVKSR